MVGPRPAVQGGVAAEGASRLDTSTGNKRSTWLIPVLFWSTWTLAAAALAVVIAVWATGSREATVTAARRDVARVAGQGAAYVDDTIGLVDSVLARLAQGTSEDDLTGANFERLCPSLVCANYSRSPKDLLIAFARSDGNVVIANASPTSASLAGRDYFEALKAADVGLAIGRSRKNNVVEGTYLPMARRLLPGDATFHGIVAAAINVELIRVFFQGLGVDVVDRISLRDARGVVLTSWHTKGEMDGVDDGCGPLNRASSNLVSSEPLKVGSLTLDACRTVRSALRAWRQQVLVVAAGASLLLLAPAVAFPAIRRRWERRRRQQLGLSGLVAGSSDAQFIVAARRDGTFVLEALTFTQGGEQTRMSAHLIGRTTRELFPPDEAELVDADYRSILASGETQRIERRISLGGKQFMWSALLVPLKAAGGGHIYGAASDLDGDALRGGGLRSFTMDVLRREDNERRRIARELHDTTGQNLIAAGFELGTVSRGLVDATPSALAALSQARSLVDASVAELRTLSYVLYPPLLDEAGVDMALETLAEGFAKRAGLRVLVSVDEDVSGRRWAPEIELALYRVAQESLTNVQRHSRATAARVGFRMDPSRQLELIIENDAGHACDVELAGDVAAEGAGIRGMRDRLEALGGKLTITRRDGAFRVVAMVPAESLSRA